MGKSHIKSMAAVLSAAMLFQSASSVPFAGFVSAAEKTSYLYGDLDGSGRLDTFDMVLLREACGDASQLDEVTKVISDLDADGKTGENDLALLRDYLLGQRTKFPAGVWYTPSLETPYNGQKTLTGGRKIEKLDRGTYAVSTGKEVFVSWRLMAQDEPDIGFNIYRTTDGVTTKLNGEALTGIFRGIADNGAALLQLPDGTTRAVVFGEITVEKERG